MHKPTYRSCFSFKLISLLRERKLWSALPTTVSVSSLLILTVTSASISFSVLGSLFIVAMAQWRQINVVKRLAVLPTAFCSDHSDGGDAISLKKKKTMLIEWAEHAAYKKQKYQEKKQRGNKNSSKEQKSLKKKYGGHGLIPQSNEEQRHLALPRWNFGYQLENEKNNTGETYWLSGGDVSRHIDLSPFATITAVEQPIFRHFHWTIMLWILLVKRTVVDRCTTLQRMTVVAAALPVVLHPLHHFPTALHRTFSIH